MTITWIATTHDPDPNTPGLAKCCGRVISDRDMLVYDRWAKIGMVPSCYQVQAEKAEMERKWLAEHGKPYPGTEPPTFDMWSDAADEWYGSFGQ